MRKQTIPKVMFSLALNAGLLTGGFALAPSFAGKSRSAPAAERQWLSIGQVHQKLEAAGFRNVERIEREHGVYEARATDRNGARVKLHINPQTGEVTERGEHRKRDREGASGEVRQREGSASAANSVDCNKRRCRDDMPQSPVSSQPAAK